MLKDLVKQKRTKIDENKEEKEKKILDSSLKLFMKKGFKDTSVQDIVNDAGIAKGTFYLYFKDKYAVQDYLIAKKSHQLLTKAVAYVEKQNIKRFDDRFIAVIDYIIDELNKNKLLLKMITKNLSYGLYNDKIASFLDDSSMGIKELFENGLKESNIKMKNPEVTLFLIIELCSSTIFSSIISKKPVPIEELKPYLYDAIRRLISE